MKNSMVVLVGTAVLLYSWAGASLAQDMPAPPPRPTTATAAQADPPMDMSGQMARMDEHMAKMQALHERMASATSPEERQQVMDEQRQAMQRCMAMMKPMMHGGSMMGQKDSPADADAHMKMMQERMDMMQKRMDMMQLMMQSMLDQQDMTPRPQSNHAQHNH